jgi:hypothetical protein
LPVPSWVVLQKKAFKRQKRRHLIDQSEFFRSKEKLYEKLYHDYATINEITEGHEQPYFNKCPTLPKPWPDCSLGNIFKAIPDRDFALLIYNPNDCGMHLIFSDETNEEMLNKFALGDTHHVHALWFTLYKNSRNGRLMPVLTTESHEKHLLCAPTNCTNLIFDAITGVNRFDCDFSNDCQVVDNPNRIYAYVNDPRTDTISVVNQYNKVFAYTLFIGVLNATVGNYAEFQAFENNLGQMDYMPYAFDSTNEVNRFEQT